MAIRTHRRAVAERVRCRLFAAALTVSSFAALLTQGASAQPSPGSQSVEGSEASKEEAERRFYKGLDLYRDGAWAPALAEFLESRSLHPTRAATRNAGLCLRRLERYDEALETFAALLREFSPIPQDERELVEQEIAELEALVGSLIVAIEERGAVVFVDDRERGTLPLPGPLRVSSGSHVVRIYKEGYLPLETRVEVAGGRTHRVEGGLRALGPSGRVRIAERSGGVVDVVVDHVVVGRTPWEGPLAVGTHVLVLRQTEEIGSEPVSLAVRLGEVTSLSVAVEPLPAQLTVAAHPAGARVSIDGVQLGRGSWRGRLKTGAHRVRVAADGHSPIERDVVLVAGGHERLAIHLVPDVARPAERDSRIVAEIDLGPAFSPTLGGVTSEGCDGECDDGLVAGGRAVLRALYEMPSGIGIGVDAGYVLVRQSVTGRASRLLEVPTGAAHAARLDDELLLQGVTVGAAAALHRGERFPLTLRFGAGVLVGAVSDRRTGRDTNGSELPAQRQSPRAQHLYVAPEARLGYAIGSRFEVSAGVTAVVLIGLNEPKWVNDGRLNTNTFFFWYDEQRMIGRTVLLLSPGLAARAHF